MAGKKKFYLFTKGSSDYIILIVVMLILALGMIMVLSASSPSSLSESGDSYNLTLNMGKPATVIALASLANEKIQYPTPNLQEKFRKYPSDGSLERIVKANKEEDPELPVVGGIANSIFGKKINE